MPFKKFVSKCFFASLLQKKVEKNSGDFLLSENLSGNGCDGHERGRGGHRGPGVPLFPLSFLSFKSGLKVNELVDAELLRQGCDGQLVGMRNFGDDGWKRKRYCCSCCCRLWHSGNLVIVRSMVRIPPGDWLS